MKTRNAFLLAIVLFVSLSAVTASAQKSQKLTSTPRSFQTFYARFRSAVLMGNKRAVASMTQFPFQYGFDAGDEGTYSKSQFIKHFTDIFGGERKIFTRKDPIFYVESGTYNLTNNDDASHFIFAKKGANYKFTGFFSEP